MKTNLKSFKPTILVVKDTKVTEQAIDAWPGLRLVIKYGDTLDNIDVEHCSMQGIIVAKSTRQSVHAVAELTLGLIIAVNRRILDGVEVMNSGWWLKGVFTNCLGLKDQTLGIIGLGKVGKQVCKMARALEMKVLVHTRSKHPGLDQQLGFQYAQDLDHLLQEANIISLHVSLNKATADMVNNQFLDKVKPDAVIVNTADAGLVNESDLGFNFDKKK